MVAMVCFTSSREEIPGGSSQLQSYDQAKTSLISYCAIATQSCLRPKVDDQVNHPLRREYGKKQIQASIRPSGKVF